VTQPVTYYRDADGDGYGNAGAGTIQACGPSNGYVLNNTDCNDNNVAINPAATEICGNNLDDNCNGIIDENCTVGLPVLLVKTYPVKEGDTGFTLLDVEMKLDRTATSTVTVNYSTSNANATAGSDYQAANGMLTILAGQTRGVVQLKIIGDLLREDNESFWLDFSNPVNALLSADPRARIMIIDDDKGKPNNNSAKSQVSMQPETILYIPTMAKRNQVWTIPQIINYENEVLIMDAQGQLVNKFVNYKNQRTIGSLATGLYFYRVMIKENGRYKLFNGRLLVTE
ncbi:MAG TPA: Calx-beta domain-containing protein, partial [Chitinophagaceae bacterium]